MNTRGTGTRTSFLKTCISAQRGKILTVVFFSFVINLLMLSVPIYLLQIFNRVIPSRSIDTLVFLTVLVVSALVTLAVLEAIRRLVFANIGAWLDKRLGGFVLSGSVIRSVDQCRPSSAQTLRDLSSLKRLFTGSSLFPILDIPWTPVFMLVLFLLHPMIGWITLIGAVMLFCVALLNEFSTRQLSKHTDEAVAASNQYASAVLRNSDVIQAMGMRSNVIATWDRYHNRSVELHSRLSDRSNKIASLAKFVRMILQIVVIGTGGYLVVTNELTAGAMIASVLLMRRAVAPMDRAISSWKVILHARQAFKSVDNRVNLAPELLSETTFPLPSGDLSLNKVCYTYPGRSRTILKDLTCKIQPGETVGLKGNTAVGKSTLARLLVGLAKPDSGTVKLDGLDITQWKAEDIGPCIGYLPQDNELFSGTVEANIARMGEIDREAVVAAAKLADVHDMIMQFPQGYETEIGEGGAYLSGGQRQRIALARAIFGSPRLIVLDEPDANLDSEGKAALAQVIDAMKRNGAIVVLISHQEKVLNFTDRILRLHRGKIDATGEPADTRGSTEPKTKAKIIQIESSGKE